MKSKTTFDEQLLKKLYEAAMKSGDPHSLVDYRDIAALLNKKETAVKNIVKHLAQANFLKKRGDFLVYLTERGCSFVLSCS